MADRRDVPTVEICLLGGFRVCRGTEVIATVEWRRRATARTLLKVLATLPGHRAHRDVVQDFIWPDASHLSARNNLNKAVNAARAALEPEGRARASSTYIRLDGHVVSLNPDTTRIDADVFEKRARKALRSHTLTDLIAAEEVYSGELLPEERYADWSRDRREHLAELYVHVLVRRAELEEEAHRVDTALDYFQQAAALEPLDEAIQRGIMRTLAMTGNASGALRQYDALAERLRADLGTAPSQETLALADEIERGAVGKKPVLPPVIDRPALALPPWVRPPQVPVLVNRTQELAILTAALSEAGRTGSAVLLTGEAGAGKTRLMAEIAYRAIAEGAQVLWGGSYAGEAMMPYGPFVEAIDRYTALLPTERREALATRYPLLACVVSSLLASEEQVDTTAQAIPPGESGTFVASIVRFLAEIGGDGVVMLVLDNLHDADPTTVQLLRHLMRVASGHRWLLLASCQDEGTYLNVDLSALVREGERERTMKRLRVPRLSRDATGELLQSLLPEGPVDDSVVTSLFALTLGNPLFIEELVRTVRAEGVLVLREGRWHLLPTPAMPLPDRIAELVQERVERLDADTLNTLSALAVAGFEAPYPRIRALVGGDEERLLTSLDSAVDAGLLEERGAGYGFRHPLFRQAVYHHLPAARRRHLHLAVAALEEQREDAEVETLAYHYAQARAHDQAIGFLLRAAHRAQDLHAHATALQYLEDALTMARASGGETAIATIREQMSWSLRVLGRYDEAAAAAQEAERMFEALGDVGHAMTAIASAAVIAFHRLRPAEGLQRIEEFCVRHGASLSDGSMLYLDAVRASLYWQAGRYEEQLALTRSALARIAHRDDVLHREWIFSSLSTWYGIALAALGRLDEALPALEQAAASAESAGDLLNLSRAVNTVAAIHQERGEFLRQEPYLSRALHAAEQLGDPARITFMLFRRAWHRMMIGAWDDAAADLDAADLLGHGRLESWATPSLLIGRGTLASLRGDLDAARRLLSAAAAVAEEGADRRSAWGAQLALAEVDLLQEEPVAALDRLDSAGQYTGMSGDDRAYLTALRAHADLLRGDLTAARRQIREALAMAEGAPAGASLPRMLRIHALIALAAADFDTAREVCTRSLHLARRQGNPFAEAEALAVLGSSYERQGARDQALNAWKGALDIFVGIGARFHTAKMNAALAGLRES